MEGETQKITSGRLKRKSLFKTHLIVTVQHKRKRFSEKGWKETAFRAYVGWVRDPCMISLLQFQQLKKKPVILECLNLPLLFGEQRAINKQPQMTLLNRCYSANPGGLIFSSDCTSTNEEIIRATGHRAVMWRDLYKSLNAISSFHKQRPRKVKQLADDYANSLYRIQVTTNSKQLLVW